MRRTNRKLSIKRETLRHLAGLDLAKVAGGGFGLKRCTACDSGCHAGGNTVTCNTEECDTSIFCPKDSDCCITP